MKNLFTNRILVLLPFILFVVVANAQMQFMPELDIEQTSFIQSSTIPSVVNKSTETMAVATSTNSGSTFTYVTTGINHTIFIPINSVSFDGQPIMTGDKIGVFYLKNGTHKCGGYTEVTNPLLNITVTAWGDDPATTNKDGFDEGEELIWKIYRDTSGLTYTADAGYSAGLPNQQFYQTNGLSALTSLAVISTGINWTYTITGNNHSILLPAGSITIQGQPISTGDKVGVFFDSNLGLMCGGFITIINSSSTNAIAAWGNDINSTVKIGFDVGEVFKWKIFQSSTGITYEAVATYGTNFSNGDTYAVNGISGITSLTTVVSNVQWNYTNTGNNHVILLPVNTVFVNGLGLNAGDMVGVFYNDSTEIKCGGYYTIVNPNQNTNITAWGDDPGSPVKDGFAIGESFQWKIFRISDNTVYDAVPVYNYSFANGGEYTVNGISGLESLTTAVNSYQALMLMQGWSFISTYIIPDDNNIENLFQSVMNDIIIIKNGDGAVFWPMFGVDLIDSLSIGQGYQLKMQNTDSIVVHGTISIPENTSINIPFGWSILGYLRQLPGNLTTLLSPIINKIIICKNDAGQVFWPQFNLDQISDMDPGEGYLIKLSSSAIYSYPANQNLPCSPQPSQAVAPSDILNVVADSVLIEANAPSQGSGEWTVISGMGGYFSDSLSPGSYFFGNQGETYQLVWTVSNNCGSTSDTVVVSFYDPANYECGMPWLDTRDNTYYNTVEIGFQCWMAENLNYGDFISDSIEADNNSIPEKYCYDNNLNLCESYGGLYRWGELMEYSTVEGNRGLCPNGWHIPSDAEWYTLENYVDTTINDPDAVGFRGNYAASKLLMGGSSGLDLLFAGMYAGSGNFYGMNPTVPNHGSYASSTENPANINNAWRRILFENENGIGREASSKYYSISVRCITDDTVSCAPQPSQANAGEDRININNEMVILGAESPVYGTGQWAIVEGQNGTVAQSANPSSSFTGILGETYKLAWTVANNCGSTSDSMMIYLLNDSDMVCGGLFPDLRDNSVYPTVQLGNQCWMTTNLDYGNFIDGSIDPLNNGIVEKYCYEDEEANCEILGGMYRWNELMEYNNVEQAQGICPDGWHIPSDSDWFILENFVDTSINNPASTGFRGIHAGTKLVSGGSSGLNIQLSGIYAGNNNYYGVKPNLPHYGYYASSTTNVANVNKTWMRIFHQNEVGVMRDFDTKYYGISVRCLANNANPCFIQPTQANAGPDQFVLNNTTTQLAANQPNNETGLWTILQGTNGNLADSSNPVSVFTGAFGETYQLVWSISNYCGTSSDTLTIVFFQNSGFYCGDNYVDTRDNRIYKTVEIGDQCWMAENLNYGTMIPSSQNPFNNGIVQKYCYGNDILNCESQGGLYRWAELMEYTTTESTQGICPFGWHIPSDVEWFELENYLDTSINNPNQVGLRGTDANTQMITGGTSGMDILFSGIYAGSNNFYGQNPYVDNFGVYATSSIYAPYDCWFRTFQENETGVVRESGAQLYSTAVRCLNDLPAPSCAPQPSQANAGPDQNFILVDSVILSASFPINGTGQWTIVSGNGGSFSNSIQENSVFFGQSSETFLLAWTVSTNCGSTSDTVEIGFACLPQPTLADAGPDQSIMLVDSVILSASFPINGTGQWTIVSGNGGSFSNSNQANSVFFGQTNETYILTWTISTNCGSTSDTVEIGFACLPQPTLADAGPDQTILANDSTQLLANFPVIGTGTWSIASGMGGNFSDSTLHNPFFYGTVGESYQLVWTITNSCGMKSDAMMVYFVDTLLFSCGNTYFDYRDGQAYGTVEINGLCWMTENLNYGTYVSTTQGQSGNLIPEKYCYQNNIAKCSVFGGLYTWDEIMQYDTLGSSQGLCPIGWHVPSDTEWYELENFVDYTVNDPTATGYRGTDVATKLMTGGSSGLEIIYSGIFYQPSGAFFGAGSINRFGSYATSTENSANTWIRTFNENNIGVSRTAESKLFGLAVRCVKN